jgi:hypothetical protein
VRSTFRGRIRPPIPPEEEDAMRRFAIAVLLYMALAGVVAGVVAAAPQNGLIIPFSCDDGSTLDLNLGAPPNQSSTAFSGKNTVFVAKHFEIVVEGEVVYAWNRGIKGFDEETLLTCTGDLGGGATATVVGYLTPRG